MELEHARPLAVAGFVGLGDVLLEDGLRLRLAEQRFVLFEGLAL